MLKNEVIIVRFDFVKRNEKVLKEGIFHFDNKLFSKIGSLVGGTFDGGSEYGEETRP